MTETAISGAAPVSRVSLAILTPPAGLELGGGYHAVVDGCDVLVRAVLERTAVIEYENGYRTVMRKANCFINPADAVFVPRSSGASSPLTVHRRLMYRP